MATVDKRNDMKLVLGSLSLKKLKQEELIPSYGTTYT